MEPHGFQPAPTLKHSINRPPFCSQFLPTVALVIFTGIVYMLDRWDLMAFYLPGTYLSWVYLRFFQLQPHTTGTYGDSSDEFKVNIIRVFRGLIRGVMRLRGVQIRLYVAHTIYLSFFYFGD